jgi:hypothetical protein
MRSGMVSIQFFNGQNWNTVRTMSSPTASEVSIAVQETAKMGFVAGRRVRAVDEDGRLLDQM